MATKKEETKFVILDKTNFRLWKWSLTNHLENKKCSYILSYTSQTSATRDKIAGASNWHSHQNEGRILLTNTLNQNDLNYVMDCDTIKSMISKLERRYSRGLNAFTLNQRFSDLKWQRTQDADSFISNLNSIYYQFNELNIVLDSSRMIQKIVSEIPSFMNDLKNDLQRRLNRNEVDSYDSVCEEIILLYDQRSATASKALINKENEVNKSVSKNKKSRYCKYHKNNSHSTEDCRALKFKNQQSNQQPTQQSNQQTTQQSNQHSNQQANRQSNQQSNRQSEQQQTKNSDQQASTSNDNFKNQLNQQNQNKQIPDIFKATMCLMNTDEIHFDTAATKFMTPNLDHFSYYIKLDDGPTVITGNGIVKAEGVGIVAIKSYDGHGWFELELSEVFYVPSLPYFLFSEPVCGEAGVDVSTDNSKGLLKLTYNGDVLFTGNRKPMSNETFLMNIRIVDKPNLSANVSIVSKLAHWRTGHCPYTDFKSHH